MSTQLDRKRFKEVTKKAREMDQRKKTQEEVQSRAKVLQKQKEGGIER